MSEENKLALPDLEGSETPRLADPNAFATTSDGEGTTRGAADLEAVFDVPVKVSAVLGRPHGSRRTAQARPRRGARTRP
jgi:flagellar motor switch protein FliN/FliY